MTAPTDHERTIALMQQGHWSEAEDRLASTLARHPDDVRALRLMGTLYHLTSRAEQARGLLERALAAEPSNTSTLLNLGSVHLGAGRLDEAGACFARVVAVDPDSPDGHFNLGLAAQQAGELDSAAQHYARALECEPDALDIAVNLAAVQLQQQRFEDCVTQSRRVLDRDPGHAEARLIHLQGLIALGRVDAAEHELATADATLRERFELHALEGELRARTSRLAEAATAYRAAIASGDKRVKTTLALGHCLLVAGEAAAAVAVLHESAVQHPDVAECHALLARALHDAGDDHAALDACDRTLALAPQAAASLTLRASVLFALGRDELAERAVDAAIASTPDDVSPHLLRVQRRAACGDVDAALDACERFLAIRRKDISMLAARGFLLHAAGRADEATALLDFDRLLQSWTIDVPDGYPDLASFNAALARGVRAHPSLSSGGAASVATQHGRQTGNLLCADSGPFADLRHVLWNAAERYLRTVNADPAHPYLAPAPQLADMHGWAVVLGRSGFQTPHIHPIGCLSGVYYPELPAIVAREASGQGWIEFGAPPPEYTFDPGAPTRRLRPEEGLVVLFPSYVYHRTLPYESDEERISIAFDFRPL